jgi:hypothetical protein
MQGERGDQSTDAATDDRDIERGRDRCGRIG